MDASPFQTPAADASPDEQPSTTIPALEQSPMRLQEQGSTDASAFQAPAADDSTDQLLFATVAVLEQSIMQPREQGSTGTPFEEGSLEAAGGKDITSDDAPMAAIQISFSPSSTKSNDGKWAPNFPVYSPAECSCLPTLHRLQGNCIWRPFSAWKAPTSTCKRQSCKSI